MNPECTQPEDLKSQLGPEGGTVHVNLGAGANATRGLAKNIIVDNSGEVCSGDWYDGGNE